MGPEVVSGVEAPLDSSIQCRRAAPESPGNVTPVGGLT